MSISVSVKKFWYFCPLVKRPLITISKLPLHASSIFSNSIDGDTLAVVSSSVNNLWSWIFFFLVPQFVVELSVFFDAWISLRRSTSFYQLLFQSSKFVSKNMSGLPIQLRNPTSSGVFSINPSNWSLQFSTLKNLIFPNYHSVVIVVNDLMLLCNMDFMIFLKLISQSSLYFWNWYPNLQRLRICQA